jgi:hypothetical protein
MITGKESSLNEDSVGCRVVGGRGDQECCDGSTKSLGRKIEGCGTRIVQIA